jgi:hypothetical protein
MWVLLLPGQQLANICIQTLYYFNLAMAGSLNELIGDDRVGSASSEYISDVVVLVMERDSKFIIFI